MSEQFWCITEPRKWCIPCEAISVGKSLLQCTQRTETSFWEPGFMSPGMWVHSSRFTAHTRVEETDRIKSVPPHSKSCWNFTKHFQTPFYRASGVTVRQATFKPHELQCASSRCSWTDRVCWDFNFAVLRNRVCLCDGEVASNFKCIV